MKFDCMSGCEFYNEQDHNNVITHLTNTAVNWLQETSNYRFTHYLHKIQSSTKCTPVEITDIWHAGAVAT